MAENRKEIKNNSWAPWWLAPPIAQNLAAGVFTCRNQRCFLEEPSMGHKAHSCPGILPAIPEP